MTDLRQAAQQALEALEDACGDRCNAEYNPCWQREIAETLRAALAEPNRAQKLTEAGYTRRPTLREMAESEPCQYPDCVDNGPDVECTRWLLDECSMREDYKPKRPAEPVLNPAPGYCKHCKQYTIEEPLPAEPVQEPFGYFRAEPFGWTDCAATDDGAIPLYAAPPQRPAEPVGVVTSMVKGGVTWHRWPADMPDGTSLYTAPPQLR